MLSSFSLNLMHQITGLLLEPVVWGLIFLLLLSLWETGLALGERWGGLQRLLASGDLARRPNRANAASNGRTSSPASAPCWG